MPSDNAQQVLAWKDSQRFIYENRGRNTKLYSDKWLFRSDAFAQRPKLGQIMEFGVYKASSINFFADKLREEHDDRKVFGFDSFKGFSEEWAGADVDYPVDFYNLNAQLPSVRENVQLVEGYVEESLPKFLDSGSIDVVSFIHIDTDTYSPAYTVLSLLKQYFQPGTIIVFDQFLGYPNWRNHEYRAFSETLDNDSYEFLAFGVKKGDSLIKCSIRIL